MDHILDGFFIMDDKILLEFLKMFEKTPNAVFLIAFCLYGIKKYVINGSLQKLLDFQQKRQDLTGEILRVMIRIEEKIDN